MSDNVLVAVIATVGNLLAIIISRVLSHREHKATSATVDRIEKKLNGHKPE